MIYLGYDICHQQEIARYKDQRIILDGGDRMAEILNGLCAVGKKMPRPGPVSGGEFGDVEVIIIPQTPYVYQVPYSDQAWNDLLSVEKP